MNGTPRFPPPPAVRISSAPEDLAGSTPCWPTARLGRRRRPGAAGAGQSRRSGRPEARRGADGVPVGDPGLRHRRRRRCRTGPGTAPGRRRRSSPRPAGQAAVEGWDCPDFDGVHFDGRLGRVCRRGRRACGSKPEAGGRLASCSTAPSPGARSPPQLDHAVLTAHLDDGGRAAFAVDLHAPGVSFADPEWTSRGLREIPSGTVHFDGRPGRAAGRRRLVLPAARLRLGRHGRGRLLAGRRRRRGPRLQGIPAARRPTAGANRTRSPWPTSARSTAPSPP